MTESNNLRGGTGSAQLLTAAHDGPAPSILGLLSIVLRQRRWFFGGLIVAALVTVYLRYPRGLSYTSEMSFFTEAPRAAPAGAAGIAAQFGVNVNQAGAANTA